MAHELRSPDERGRRHRVDPEHVRRLEPRRCTLEGFRVDVERVIEASAGRYLVEVRFSGRGMSSGAPVTLEAAHLITIRSGLAAQLTGYPGWSEGLRAAGIEGP